MTEEEVIADEYTKFVQSLPQTLAVVHDALKDLPTHRFEEVIKATFGMAFAAGAQHQRSLDFLRKHNGTTN